MKARGMMNVTRGFQGKGMTNYILDDVNEKQ